MERDCGVRKLSKPKPVQKNLQAGYHYFVADTGVKSDAGTDGKSPALLLIFQYADVEVFVV